MPDDRQPVRQFGPRRPRRFVVRDTDDHRATEKIERFLSGPVPQAEPPMSPRLERTGSTEAVLDTRTDFAAALRRETARAERYGRPATVVAIEFAAFPGATSKPDHDRTDRLARPIGFTLRREARDTDRIVRVAPNRFHVLLPETSEADAFRYVDRARYACEMWFMGAELPIRLRIETASAGPDQSLIEALAAVEDRLSA
jgi:diguanylate cyclase (GGDEF)-like protein